MKLTEPKWKSLPITWAQMQILDQLGIHYDERSTTRGEASEMITEGIEDSDHPYSEDALQP